MARSWHGSRATGTAPRSGESQSDYLVKLQHHSLLAEHLRIMRRKTFHESIEARQKALDAHLVHSNTERPHQGRGMKGRTPADVFMRRAQAQETKGGQNENSGLNQNPAMSGNCQPITLSVHPVCTV